MEINNAYKHKMSAQLKEWEAEIDLMQAKIENVGADWEIDRARELNELRGKLNQATEKMGELESASGEAWEQVKVTAEVLWNDLKAGVAATHAKFK